MITAFKAGFCVAALFTFVMSSLFAIEWVYPSVAARPFGQSIFVGIMLGVFAVMGAVVYLSLKAVMKSDSRSSWA